MFTTENEKIAILNGNRIVGCDFFTSALDEERITP